MRQPKDYHEPGGVIWVAEAQPMLSRWQSALNIFVAGMGILGWALLLLFLWVATP